MISFSLLMFFRLKTCLVWVNILGSEMKELRIRTADILGSEMKELRIRIAEHKTAEESNPTTKDPLLDCIDKNNCT